MTHIYCEATWNVTNDGRVEIKTLAFTEEERKHYEEVDRVYEEMVRNEGKEES